MSKKSKNPTPKHEIPGFALQRENYILIIAGLLLIILGFILMIGGGADHPSEFSEDIFSPRRITVAPLLILAGYVVEIIAIMYKPRSKETPAEGTSSE